jgi:hypothetical protein
MSIPVLTWVGSTGTELELSGDLLVMDAPIGLDLPATALTTATSAGDGQVLTYARHDARTIALPLAILTEDVRGVKGTLASLFNVRRGAGQLRHAVDGRTRTLRNVIYQGGLEGDETKTRSDWATMVLSLLALDPFWYADSQSIVVSSPDVPAAWDSPIPWSSPYPWNGPGVGINAGLGWDEPLAWDSAIPWNGGVIAAPGVEGDAGTWPTFTFKGPATSFEVIHIRTGERIASALPLSAQTLIVETQPGSTRGPTLNGEPAWEWLTLDSTSEMLLEPGDTLAVRMAGTGVDSYVRVAWTDRWLTPYTGDLTPLVDTLETIDGGSA